ncbi:hypothetical protein Ccrd_022360, partial [Cynara cardunculus var. scolymus]
MTDYHHVTVAYSTPNKSSFCLETMNTLPSIGYMDSMMNIKEDSILNNGRFSLIASISLLVTALIDEKFMCPTYVPNDGFFYDLLWLDPFKAVKGWGMNDHGVSYTFGAKIVTGFLQKHDVDH